jgi:hypothetical protein
MRNSVHHRHSDPYRCPRCLILAPHDPAGARDDHRAVQTRLTCFLRAVSGAAWKGTEPRAGSTRETLGFRLGESSPRTGGTHSCMFYFSCTSSTSMLVQQSISHATSLPLQARLQHSSSSQDAQGHLSALPTCAGAKVVWYDGLSACWCARHQGAVALHAAPRRAPVAYRLLEWLVVTLAPSLS